MDVVDRQSPGDKTGVAYEASVTGGAFTFLSVRFQWQRHNFLFRLASFWLQARDWNVIFGAFNELSLPGVFPTEPLNSAQAGNISFQGRVFIYLFVRFF